MTNMKDYAHLDPRAGEFDRIVVRDEERMAQVFERLPLLHGKVQETFWDAMRFLEGVCRNRGGQVVLAHDFAPLSFFFYFEGGNTRMNGGVIFHGQHDGGGDGGAPTFSVNVTEADSWEIHT